MNKVVKNPSMPAALSPELLKKIDKVGPVQRCGIETINLAVNECHLLLRDGTPALIRRLVLASNTAMLACAPNWASALSRILAIPESRR